MSRKILQLFAVLVSLTMPGAALADWYYSGLDSKSRLGITYSFNDDLQVVLTKSAVLSDGRAYIMIRYQRDNLPVLDAISVEGQPVEYTRVAREHEFQHRRQVYQLATGEFQHILVTGSFELVLDGRDHEIAIPENTQSRLRAAHKLDDRSLERKHRLAEKAANKN